MRKIRRKRNPCKGEDFLIEKKMLLKICSKCGKKIEQGKTCTCQKQRHQLYNRYDRDRVKNTFYHSLVWSKVSKKAKERANGLDEYALKYEHQLIRGNLTHHIFELNDRADLSLSMDNLIYVSTKTHALIHAAYQKDEKTKIEMQNKLLNIRKI